MPFRAHYAKKEAREHSIAQNALAAGDLKQWHKHEAKAHRAGSHARGNGLMHTDYLMFGKENMAPMGVAPMVTPVPVGVPTPVPVPVESTPIYTTTTQSTSFMMPVMSPMAPPAIEVASPYQEMMPAVMSGGVDVYGGMMAQQGGPTIMAANTIYDGGMATLEPTIIMEEAIVEEPRTIIEYGEPIMPVTQMEGMGMGYQEMMPAVMSGSSMGMMPAVMSGMSASAFTETQYGLTQFVGENVMMM